MRDVHPREIQIYRTPNGRQPFMEWLRSIRNQKTQRQIRARLAQFEDGNFGDYKSVGEGVLNCVFTLGQVIASILDK